MKNWQSTSVRSERYTPACYPLTEHDTGEKHLAFLIVWMSSTALIPQKDFYIAEKLM